MPSCVSSTVQRGGLTGGAGDTLPVASPSTDGDRLHLVKRDVGWVGHHRQTGTRTNTIASSRRRPREVICVEDLIHEEIARDPLAAWSLDKIKSLAPAGQVSQCSPAAGASCSHNMPALLSPVCFSGELGTLVLSSAPPSSA